MGASLRAFCAPRRLQVHDIAGDAGRRPAHNDGACGVDRCGGFGLIGRRCLCREASRLERPTQRRDKIGAAVGISKQQPAVRPLT
jgi:hypothetical protein